MNDADRQAYEEIAALGAPALGRYHRINVMAHIALRALGRWPWPIYPPMGISAAARRAAHEQKDT